MRSAARIAPCLPVLRCFSRQPCCYGLHRAPHSGVPPILPPLLVGTYPRAQPSRRIHGGGTCGPHPPACSSASADTAVTSSPPALPTLGLTPCGAGPLLPNAGTPTPGHPPQPHPRRARRRPNAWAGPVGPTRTTSRHVRARLARPVPVVGYRKCASRPCAIAAPQCATSAATQRSRRRCKMSQGQNGPAAGQWCHADTGARIPGGSQAIGQ